MEALNYIANDSVPPTTWRTVVASIFHYSTLPILISFRTAISILHTIFLPLIYLSSFFYSIAVYPFSLLWKLEVSASCFVKYAESYYSQTIYIYLSIAAFIGVLTGCILYFFSSILIELLSLDQPAPPLFDQLTKSIYGGRTLGTPSESTLAICEKTEQDEGVPWYSGKQARKLETLSRRRGLDGLRNQPILEEDSDDSHF